MARREREREREAEKKKRKERKNSISFLQMLVCGCHKNRPRNAKESREEVMGRSLHSSCCPIEDSTIPVITVMIPNGASAENEKLEA